MAGTNQLAEEIKDLDPADRLRFAPELLESGGTSHLRIVKQLCDRTSGEIALVLATQHLIEVES